MCQNKLLTNYFRNPIYNCKILSRFCTIFAWLQVFIACSTVNYLHVKNSFCSKENSCKEIILFGCSCTQNCDKKQYLIPQLGGGITQPHVIQNTIIFIHSSHNHKQWTRQVSGSMMASLLRPFYWVTNRCTDVAPVLGREIDLEEVIIIRHHSRTPVLHLCKKGNYCKFSITATHFCAGDSNDEYWYSDILNPYVWQTLRML